MRQKLRTHRLPKSVILLLASLVFFLSGCVYVQANLAIYGEEAWRGVQAIQISPEFVALMEQDGSSGQGQDGEGLTEWLNDAETISQRDDLNVAFEQVKGEDGSQSFILTADGRQLETMNEVFFDGKADISVEVVNGQRQITIRHDVSTSTESGEPGQKLSPEEMQMQMQMMEAMGLSFVFKISGGEIIRSNATRVEGNTAIWQNPTLIEVTLTEAAEIPPDALTLSAPPAGSSFSAEAFSAMMEGMEEEFGVSIEDPAGSSSTVTEPITEEAPPVAEEAPDVSMPVDATPDDDISPNVETPDDGEMDSQGIPFSAPAEEEQPLPDAGAVLPPDSPGLLLGLAGLMLLGLVGTGLAKLLKGH